MQEADASERTAAEVPDKHPDQDQGLIDDNDESLPDLVPGEPLEQLQVTGYALGGRTVHQLFHRHNSPDSPDNNGGALDIGSFRGACQAPGSAGPSSPCRAYNDMEPSRIPSWRNSTAPSRDCFASKEEGGDDTDYMLTAEEASDGVGGQGTSVPIMIKQAGGLDSDYEPDAEDIDLEDNDESLELMATSPGLDREN